MLPRFLSSSSCSSNLKFTLILCIICNCRSLSKDSDLLKGESSCIWLLLSTYLGRYLCFTAYIPLAQSLGDCFTTSCMFMIYVEQPNRGGPCVRYSAGRPTTSMPMLHSDWPQPFWVGKDLLLCWQQHQQRKFLLEE